MLDSVDTSSVLAATTVEVDEAAGVLAAQVTVDANEAVAAFLVRLEELVDDRPFDIVNLRLEVPTVKGARAKAPAFMAFEVASEAQDDVEPFLAEVHALVRDASLVLVGTTRL